MEQILDENVYICSGFECNEFDFVLLCLEFAASFISQGLSQSLLVCLRHPGKVLQSGEGDG